MADTRSALWQSLRVMRFRWSHVCGRVKLAGLRHTLTEAQIAALARAAHGFVGADIAALCSEAAMTALRRCVTADGA